MIIDIVDKLLRIAYSVFTFEDSTLDDKSNLKYKIIVENRHMKNPTKRAGLNNNQLELYV